MATHHHSNSPSALIVAELPEFDLEKTMDTCGDDFASFDMSRDMTKATAATAQESQFTLSPESSTKQKRRKQMLLAKKNPDAYTKEVLQKMMNESERDFAENAFGGFGDFEDGEDPFAEPDFSASGDSNGMFPDETANSMSQSERSSKASKTSKDSSAREKKSKKSSKKKSKKKQQELMEQQLQMQRLLLAQQQKQMELMEQQQKQQQQQGQGPRLSPQEQKLDAERLKNEIVADNEDDSSIMSDLTGLTGAFPSSQSTLSKKSNNYSTTLSRMTLSSDAIEEASQEDNASFQTPSLSSSQRSPGSILKTYPPAPRPINGGLKKSSLKPSSQGGGSIVAKKSSLRPSPQGAAGGGGPSSVSKSAMKKPLAPKRSSGNTSGSKKSCLARPRTASQQSRQPNNKHPQFSTISIHTHERILCENPSTQLGPSIGIGWRATHITLNLNEYEQKRRPIVRRNLQLVLNREQREKMLLELGYSQKDLANAVRNITKARNLRKQTVSNLKAEAMEEAMEGTTKRFAKMFGRKK